MEDCLVDVQNMHVWFQARTGILSKRKPTSIRAVDGVSFKLHRGETLALVGESGSGKTTVGRAIMGLLREAAGEVWFKDRNVLTANRVNRLHLRTKMQMIYQDPFDAMNPRETIFKIVTEPLSIHRKGLSAESKQNLVHRALTDVGLIPPEDFLARFPHELSGGQRQRVLIATALVLDPDLVIADEPVSMLDASLKVEILDLLVDLHKKRRFTQLMITHDLALTRYVADRIAIMYLGKIMELGPTRPVLADPYHPYTRALIKVVPTLDKAWAFEGKAVLSGEIPHPSNVPPGCRFHPRCPKVTDICRTLVPEPRTIGPRMVLCHHAS
ncbi:MAG: ABC transporter ATP-binding protein [Desulfobacterales bacterium]|nr:ABC transporter ATP-binding protein [Desulfobacterales bacterium]